MQSNLIRILAATCFIFCIASGKETVKPKAAKALVDTSKMSCKSTSDDLDRLLVVFSEARKSDDKAKMKSALEMAESHIFGMKSEMSKCMDMMDLMGGMIAEKSAPALPGAAKEEHSH